MKVPPRLNRPDGISQSNRADPYFIILRRYAESEKAMTLKLTRFFIVYILIGVIFPTLIPGVWIALFYRQLWPCIFALFIVHFTALIYHYRQWKKLVGATVHTKVDHMIFSNDYRDAQLNQEDVWDKTLDCHSSIERMNLFINVLRASIVIQIELTIAIVAVGCIIANL